MSCGFWLRLNGQWVALDGVQAGVGRESERPSSSGTSVGGVRHWQSARRAARSWDLDFGMAGPEAVTALAIAAQGDGGDVMLWDESIARQNLLDPIPLAARPGYPVVMCGSMPLVSLTAGPSAATKTDTVPLKAHVRIQADHVFNIHDFLVLSPGEVDALVKVMIPPTPAGMDLVSAELLLTAVGDVDGTINAHAFTNAWIEQTDIADTYDIPAGVLLGSAPAASTTVVPLGDVTAYVGTDLSVRLSQTGGTGSMFNSRFVVNPPMVRLTYAVLAKDRTFDQHLRPGTYILSAWTDAEPGTQIGTLTTLWGGVLATGPLTITAGTLTDPSTGWRYVAIELPEMENPIDVSVALFDSADYLLAGAMLSTLDHPGVYMSAQKTPVRVRVEDPKLTLDRLLPGEQGIGQRSVTLSEVGV